MCSKTGIWIMLFDNVEFVSNKREQHAHTHTYIACECDCHLCVLCPTEIKSSNKIIWRFWPHSNKSTVFRSICVFFYIFHLFFSTFEFIIFYFFLSLTKKANEKKQQREWTIREFYESATAVVTGQKQLKWRNLWFLQNTARERTKIRKNASYFRFLKNKYDKYVVWLSASPPAGSFEQQ